MRSLGGFILLAGIGVALFVYLPAPVDSGTSLDHLQRVAASRAAQLPPKKFTPVSRLSAFSPSIALTMPPRRGTRSATVAKVEPAPAPAPVVVQAEPGWQTVVAVAAPAPTPALQPTKLAPNDPEARYKLVLDIQQQLKRVGCYWGRMDGSWGIGTKDAMKEFTDRVNAALPLDEPDYVQLTLIQSHAEKTCGACPVGQSLSATGRCVGQPITAQAKRAGAPQVASTQQKEVLPWKATSGPGVAGGQPLFRPMPTTVVSNEPLPGRMAIGGPIPTTVDAQGSAPVAPGVVTAPVGMATAALDPNAPAAVAPPVTAPTVKEPKHRASNSSGNSGRSYRHEGPGSPHYNLMLSLGGIY
jgi:hypothetical protein